MTIEELESAIVNRLKGQVTDLNVVACPSNVAKWGPLAESGAVFVRYDRTIYEPRKTPSGPVKYEQRFVISIGMKSLRTRDGHKGTYEIIEAVLRALSSWPPESKQEGEYEPRVAILGVQFAQLDEKRSIWWYNISTSLTCVDP